MSGELDKVPAASDMSRALKHLFDVGNSVQMRVLEIMGLGLELDVSLNVSDVCLTDGYIC